MTGLSVALLLMAASAVLTLSSGRGGPRQPTAVVPPDGCGISDPALILDLLGALLSAGCSVEGALSTVGDACAPALSHSLAQVHAARMLGASWESAWDAGSVDGESGPASPRTPASGAVKATLDEVQQGLRFATSTGAPSAALLHAHAAQLRRRHNREVDRRAAALGVQLVLPLGLCSLPAFICLGVVPVVLGLLPDL